MFALKLMLSLAVLAVITSVIATQFAVRRVEAQFPPMGAFADIDGVRLHFIDLPDDGVGKLEPMIFLHGASGNARDLMGALAGPIGGRARMIFVDRPGAGYSERGGLENASPSSQSRLIAGLMEHLEIDSAIIVGHSLGGAVTAAFAVNHPEKVSGLVFLAPATHVWPGGSVSWYYDLTNLPIIGHVFSETLAVPFGHLLYRSAVKGVFRPNRVPRDYDERSGTRLVLRPATFRYNSRDVGRLYESVATLSPRYREIDAPTVIIAGDSDDVVSTEIHSQALHREISRSRLVVLAGTGHTPSYSDTGAVVAEIEKLNAEIAADRRKRSASLRE